MFLHLHNEIRKGGIVEFILLEVHTESLAEVLLFHKVKQLFHGCGSLGVSDAVEDRVSNSGVRNGSPDGMSGNHLVFRVSPGLSVKERCHTGLVVDSLAVESDFLQAEVADEISKTLIEPEIVPPLHGDQIPEPVVSQFVGDGIGEGQHPFSRHLLLPDIDVIEGDTTGIFHGSPLVLVHKYLVVLVEGELIAKEGLEELHRFNSNFKDEGSQILHVAQQRLNAVDGHRDSIVGLLQLELLVRSGHKGKQIGGQQFGLWENGHISIDFLSEFSQQFLVGGLDMVEIVFLIEGLHVDSRVFVGEHLLPVLRADHIESHCGLQVRLVEQGEHPVGVVGLELGVEILFSINIDEADAATAIVVIFVAIPDGNMVFSFLEISPINEDESFLGLPCLNVLVVD